MNRSGRTRESRGPRETRGQANLPVLAVALVLLTTVTAVSVALADGALVSADRDAADRRIANAVAARLTAADASVTTRANVLNETAVESLNATELRQSVPTARAASVRVRLAGQTLVEHGTPTDGVTVRRVVLVSNRTSETRTLDLSTATSVTLPRRTARVRLDVQTGTDTTVSTVRANDRVVLHDDTGLSDGGVMEVRASRYETTTLSFEASGERTGTVTVTYYPAETTKAVLAVTADA
ncbi:DUF7263 family protein [Halogranum rubrum]|uniref:Uncharacterized protein n=1 Tax=Halogranum salarium B-1 TaxID=1210908 RepID=J3EZ61_9EURY|nr:hypothetical protein [Halogranum salarium]EJN60797.1 hypothetical protein HSB1_14000 [Halogranum salarium B-1]